MLKYALIFLVTISGYIISQPETRIIFPEMKSRPGIFKENNTAYPGDTTYDVKFYKLKLSLDYDSEMLVGEVLVGFNIPSALNASSIYLDLKSNMIVDSVKSADHLLSNTHSGDKLIINFGKPFTPKQYYELTVHYHGSPGENNFGGFVFDATPQGNPIIWSLSQPYEAKNWWPCKDALNDKADSSEVWITAKPYFTSVSNGTLIEVVDNPNGTRTYKWKEHHPIAHYLISIAMADYILQTDYFHYSPVDSMQVTNYVWRESYTDHVKQQLSRIIPALQVFSGLYGPYPWLDEKYGHAQCSFGGGMEHQTIASVGDFEEDLIVHELAHQWFGDKITCRTWQDIWLNEGFATYSVALYREKIYGKSSYTSYISNNMQRAFSALNSIYVKNISSLNEIFDSNRSYAKGAIVLHMLRGVVGDSVFFRILKTYISDPRFIYGTATTADFQSIAESVSGKDLDYFFSEWIFGQNYPRYTVTWGYKHIENANYTINISIDQKTNLGPAFFTMPIQIRVKTQIGDTLLTIFNDKQHQSFSINITGLPLQLEFDPNYLILKTYSLLTDSTVELLLKSYRLSQNYPNPFNPTTKIDFTVAEDGVNREFNVLMKVYDVLGNQMAVLVNNKLPAGEHSITFEPAKYGLASGIYFYNLSVRSPENNVLYNNTRKMIYLR